VVWLDFLAILKHLITDLMQFNSFIISMFDLPLISRWFGSTTLFQMIPMIYVASSQNQTTT